MEFQNNFSVDAPIERVWAHLIDVQSVAPCVPGASITEAVSDTEYRGSIKVKLGPVQVTYSGTIEIKELDEAARRIVIASNGSETRGTGTVSGDMTATLRPQSPTRTTVEMVTEVSITGRIAQFGRNIIQDVSNRMIDQFAQCLEKNLAAESDGSVDDDITKAESPQTTSTVPESRSMTETANQAETSRALVPKYSPASGSTELKVLPLMVGITRARLAAGLRTVANWVDSEGGK